MGVNKESLFFSVYIFQHAFIRDFSHIYIHNVWLLLFFSGLGKDRNVAYVRNIHCICLGTHVCLSFFISFFFFLAWQCFEQRLCGPHSWTPQISDVFPDLRPVRNEFMISHCEIKHLSLHSANSQKTCAQSNRARAFILHPDIR